MTNSPDPQVRADLPLYLVEALTSLAATWLCTGTYFIVQQMFGWGVAASLLLAAAQGVVYVCGALLASRLTAMMGKRTLLIVVYLTMSGLTGCMGLLQRPVPFIILLLAWMFLCALNWPAVESLLCHGKSAEDMSKRVGRYNIIWAATGALAIAVVGFLSAGWIFLLGSFIHLGCAGLVWMGSARDETRTAAHLEAPFELLRKRELAKRLSRLALPASYTVIYTLTPLLASLPSVKELSPGMQGVVVSVWLVARVGVFWWMGATEFWHTRPGVLLGAVVVMALGLWGALFEVGDTRVGVAWVAAAQVVLGGAMGVIYAGSLYFGMVLSHGGEGEGSSTEQGGYHEAMVGLGTVIGPGVGVGVMWMGMSAGKGVAAVVAASVLACGVAAWNARALRRQVEG